MNTEVQNGSMVDESTLRRLVYVKSLYDLAVEDFQKGNDVANSRSIITLDNCIETFFSVVVNKKDPKAKIFEDKDKNRRGEFWILLDEIKKDESDLDVSSIRVLHEVRNNIQHHGQLIAESQAKGLFVSISIVLCNLTQKYFGMSFDDISLSLLIRSSKIAQLIHESEKYIEKGEFQNAAKKLIMGFELAKLNRQASQFGSGITSKKIDAKLLAKKYPTLKDFVEYVITLDSEIEVMKLGLDYMKWRIYRLPLGTINPHISLYRDWKLKKDLRTNEILLFEDNPDIIQEWVRINLNFVIESVLRWENTTPFDEMVPFNVLFRQNSNS